MLTTEQELLEARYHEILFYLLFSKMNKPLQEFMLFDITKGNKENWLLEIARRGQPTKKETTQALMFFDIKTGADAYESFNISKAIYMLYKKNDVARDVVNTPLVIRTASQLRTIKLINQEVLVKLESLGNLLYTINKE